MPRAVMEFREHGTKFVQAPGPAGRDGSRGGHRPRCGHGGFCCFRNGRGWRVRRTCPRARHGDTRDPCPTRACLKVRTRCPRSTTLWLSCKRTTPLTTTSGCSGEATGSRSTSMVARRTRIRIPTGGYVRAFNETNTNQAGDVTQCWNASHLQFAEVATTGSSDPRAAATGRWRTTRESRFRSTTRWPDFPALRPLLLFGAGPDVPEPALSDGGYGLRPDCHRDKSITGEFPPTAPSSTASMHTASAGRVTPPTPPRSTSLPTS